MHRPSHTECRLFEHGCSLGCAVHLGYVSAHLYGSVLLAQGALSAAQLLELIPDPPFGLQFEQQAEGRDLGSVVRQHGQIAAASNRRSQ